MKRRMKMSNEIKQLFPILIIGCLSILLSGIIFAVIVKNIVIHILTVKQNQMELLERFLTSFQILYSKKITEEAKHTNALFLKEYELRNNLMMTNTQILMDLIRSEIQDLVSQLIKRQDFAQKLYEPHRLGEDAKEIAQDVYHSVSSYIAKNELIYSDHYILNFITTETDKYLIEAVLEHNDRVKILNTV